MNRKAPILACAAAGLLIACICAVPGAPAAASGRPVLESLTLQDENGLRASVAGEGAQDPERCLPGGELSYFISQRSPLSGMAQGESWQEFGRSPLSANCRPVIQEALAAPLPAGDLPGEDPTAPGAQGLWLRAVFALPASAPQAQALGRQRQVVVLFRPQASPADLWMFWAIAPQAAGAPALNSFTDWGLEQLKGYGDWFEKEAGLFFSYNTL